MDPVAVATFQQTPIVTLNAEKLARLEIDKKREFVASCPREVFSMQGDLEVRVKNELECVHCEECLKFAEEIGEPDLVAIDTKEREFIFSVESTGALRPERIVEKAIEVLREKLALLESEANQIDSHHVY